MIHLDADTLTALYVLTFGTESIEKGIHPLSERRIVQEWLGAEAQRTQILSEFYAFVSMHVGWGHANEYLRNTIKRNARSFLTRWSTMRDWAQTREAYEHDNG